MHEAIFCSLVAGAWLPSAGRGSSARGVSGVEDCALPLVDNTVRGIEQNTRSKAAQVALSYIKAYPVAAAERAVPNPIAMGNETSGSESTHAWNCRSTPKINENVIGALGVRAPHDSTEIGAKALVRDKEIPMRIWNAPQVREQAVGLEVTSYLPAEIDII